MAMYKVPQDVEADDKLIGPFSFRQFIYLIIVAIAIAIGWGLSRLFIPLAIIPLPIVLFFGALALPLRKDQPMEIYLAAIVSFHLKPRKRLWVPDGIQSLVEITAPKTVEVHRTKDLSQSEAQQRLSYLADIVDTGGWAIRGVAMPDAPSPMKSDVFYEAQQTEDVLGDDGGVSRNIDAMMSQADAKRRQEAIARMHQPDPEPVQPPTPDPYQVPDPYTVLSSAPAPNMTSPADPRFNFNPYPSSMRQHVISPISDQPPAPAPQPPVAAESAPETAPQQPQQAPQPQPLPQQQPVEQVIEQPVAPQPEQPAPDPTPPPQPAPVEPVTTSEKPPSPDILNLVNSSGLSIETIAHEANRISQRDKQADEEVVISLR